MLKGDLHYSACEAAAAVVMAGPKGTSAALEAWLFANQGRTCADPGTDWRGGTRHRRRRRLRDPVPEGSGCGSARHRVRGNPRRALDADLLHQRPAARPGDSAAVLRSADRIRIEAGVGTRVRLKRDSRRGPAEAGLYLTGFSTKSWKSKLKSVDGDTASHLRLIDAAVRIERERHVGVGAQLAILPPRDERVVLPMLERPGERRRLREPDREAIPLRLDHDVAVPLVAIRPGVGRERQ